MFEKELAFSSSKQASWYSSGAGVKAVHFGIWSEAGVSKLNFWEGGNL